MTRQSRFSRSPRAAKGQARPRPPRRALEAHNLGVAYDHVGRAHEAITLLDETVELMKARLGVYHPTTLMCRFSLARAHRTAGRTAEAIRLYEATLNDRQAKLADHPETLRTRSALAATYLAAGRTADAITLFEPTLKALEAKLGADNGVAIGCRYNLGAAYRAAGRTAESMATLEKSLKIMVPKLGPDDPDTLWVRRASPRPCVS